MILLLHFLRGVLPLITLNRIFLVANAKHELFVASKGPRNNIIQFFDEDRSREYLFLASSDYYLWYYDSCLIFNFLIMPSVFLKEF